MRPQLIVVFVVEPFDVQRENDPPDRFLIRLTFLDRAVHPLDLAAPRENSPPDCFLVLVAPRVVGLGLPVLDAVRLTDHVEAHWPRADGVAVPGLLSELNTAAIGLEPMAHQ